MIIKSFEMYELTLGLKASKKRVPSEHEKFQQINPTAYTTRYFKKLFRQLSVSDFEEGKPLVSAP